MFGQQSSLNNNSTFLLSSFPVTESGYSVEKKSQVKAIIDNYSLDTFISIPGGTIWVPGVEMEVINIDSFHADNETGKIKEMKFSGEPKVVLLDEWEVAGVNVTLNYEMTNYIINNLIFRDGKLDFNGEGIEILELADEDLQLLLHSNFIKTRLKEMIDEFDFDLVELRFEKNDNCDVMGRVKVTYDYDGRIYHMVFPFTMPKWGYEIVILDNEEKISPNSAVLFKIFLNTLIKREFKNGE